jgi:hypothetical protein
VNGQLVQDVGDGYGRGFVSIEEESHGIRSHFIIAVNYFQCSLVNRHLGLFFI